MRGSFIPVPSIGSLCSPTRRHLRMRSRSSSRSFSPTLRPSAPLGNFRRAADALRHVAYGVSGFVNAFGDFLSAWESWVVTPTEFIDVDESRVLVIYDIQGRSKTHQAEMPFEGANLITIKDGKVAQSELFNTKQEALEAAGLRE